MRVVLYISLFTVVTLVGTATAFILYLKINEGLGGVGRYLNIYVFKASFLKHLKYLVIRYLNEYEKLNTKLQTSWMSMRLVFYTVFIFCFSTFRAMYMWSARLLLQLLLLSMHCMAGGLLVSYCYRLYVGQQVIWV